MNSPAFLLPLLLLGLNACGESANPMTVPEYETRIRAAEAEIEAVLSLTCSETSQCRHLVLAGLCEPHYKPYSTATTDAGVLDVKVSAYEGIKEQFSMQGTPYPCNPVIYPEPSPLACVNSRCS